MKSQSEVAQSCQTLSDPSVHGVFQARVLEWGAIAFSKVRCYKEQYCIGTWNVRSMNQGKLEVVKQEMARVNMDILGIGELK